MEEMNLNEVMPETQQASEPTGIEALKVTEWMRDNLLRAMNWLKFLAVLSVIGIGLMFVFAIVMIAYPFIDGLSIDNAYAMCLGIVYLVCVAIYVYPLLKTFKLIKNTREAMNGSQDEFAQTTDNLYSIMKYFGILSIIFLVLYIPIIIVALILGLFFM